MRLLTLLAAVSVLTAGAVAQDAKAEFATLNAAYKAEMDAYSTAIQKIMKSEAYVTAREARDRPTMNKLRRKVARPERAGWADKAAVGAKKFAGSDGAIPFLEFVANMGSSDQLKAAVHTLSTTHVASAEVGDFVGSLSRLGRRLGMEETKAVAAKFIADSPHKSVKAKAHYARATLLGRSKSAADKAQVKADHQAVLALAPDSKEAARVIAPEFEKTRLQVGMEVPDIVGEDIDGVDFKLSDYRGKVVFLDFWGDW